MKKNVVVIGGGHGQSQICRSIKNIEDIDISAIVTVADDGGSTGRLRRQFSIPAMGDIRNVMISLAESESTMSALMDYRFDDPDGTETDIHGHNLGNLILTAMTQLSGSFLDAVQTIEQVLNVKGRIIPATTQVITLYALMRDGVIVKGEANIPTVHNHISRVFYDTEVSATPEAVEAIRDADLIIYGLGSIYTSLIANVIIPEIAEALNETEAKRVYFANAMTQPGETDGYSVEDHVQALLDHGVPVDCVIIPDDELPAENVRNYFNENSMPVILTEDEHDYEIIETSLLSFENGLIRHDTEKVKAVVEQLLEEL